MTFPLNANIPAQGHRTLAPGVVYTNGGAIAVWLDTKAISALPKSISIARHYAMLLTARIQANASGRPGPNIITGEYRASWQWKVTWTASGEVRATVWTDQPQGRRLEYGFVGRDSLGRLYDQAPLPHMMPAVRETGPEWMVAIKSIPEAT